MNWLSFLDIKGLVVDMWLSVALLFVDVVVLEIWKDKSVDVIGLLCHGDVLII